MSSERTPILCGAIPAFEVFMSAWEKLVQGVRVAEQSQESADRLKEYAQPGLDCAYDYYERMDLTRAYVVTMRKCLCLLTSDYSANCYLQS
jgi:hypothetical protein